MVDYLPRNVKALAALAGAPRGSAATPTGAGNPGSAFDGSGLRPIAQECCILDSCLLQGPPAATAQVPVDKTLWAYWTRFLEQGLENLDFT